MNVEVSWYQCSRHVKEKYGECIGHHMSQIFSSMQDARQKIESLDLNQDFVIENVTLHEIYSLTEILYRFKYEYKDPSQSRMGACYTSSDIFSVNKNRNSILRSNKYINVTPIEILRKINL